MRACHICGYRDGHHAIDCDIGNMLKDYIRERKLESPHKRRARRKRKSDQEQP